MGKRKIEIARAYSLPESGEHYRVLVDRLWPRGVTKESLHLGQWSKELAPSNELRKWFDHDVAKWEEFRERYRQELADNAGDVKELLETSSGKPVLLVYAAKDEEHNNAVVLREYMEKVGK